MTAVVDLGEVIDHDVGVPDRALDIGVPQELLDVADGCPVFKEVGGRGVAYRVGRDIDGIHAKAPQKLAEVLAHKGTGEVSIVAREDPGLRPLLSFA